MSNILDITGDISYDNSITKIDYHTYSPFLTSFKNSDEIRISVQHQDLYVLPAESFIYIEGALVKLEGTISDTAELVNNAVAFLFEEIRYEINGVEIDRTRNLGIATSLKNYISLNRNESQMLFNAGWSPEKSIKTTKGFFNFCVPLKIFLGFAEDYKKIIANAKHELILIRSRIDEDAIVSPTDAVNIEIFKLQWRIPHVNVADHEKLALLKIIESGREIQISFRSWDIYEYPALPAATHHTWSVKTSSQMEKPRYIILALQTNRKNDKTKDASKFDHCKLTDVKVHLNSESYPYDDLNLKFDKNQYALLYDMYIKFQTSYYGRQFQPLLSREEFISSAPISVIDCSRQNEAIKTGPVDIRLEFKTSENVPANTTAYCLLLHDRIVQYIPLTSEVRKLA